MEISKYLKKTTYLMNKYNLKFDYIYDYEKMVNFMSTLKNKNTATDIETNSFNFWNGKMISIAFATNQSESTVFSTRHLSDEEIKNIIELYNSNVANSYIYNHYFDRSFTMGKYGAGLKCTHDALLYVHMMYPQRKLNKSGLSLKDVTRDVSKLGDYEQDLVEFKNEYCKENKILMKDFTYDLIPDELLLPYNCLAYNSVLHLKNNGKMSIKDIVRNKISDEILSYNIKENKFEYKKITNWITNKHNDLWYSYNLKYNTDNKQKVKFTGNHKILTKDGYKEAKNIRIGDNVIFKGKIPSSDTKDFIYGSLMGDGGLQSRNGKGVGLVISQSIDREEYFYMKLKAVGCMYDKPLHIYKMNKNNRICLKTVTPYLDYFRKIRDNTEFNTLNTNTKPIFTEKFIENINKLSFAVWFFDDGFKCYTKTKNKKEFIRIGIKYLSKDEVNNIINRLSYLFCIPKESIKYYESNSVLSFSPESSEIIWRDIVKYASNDLLYKFSNKSLNSNYDKYVFNFYSEDEVIYDEVVKINTHEINNDNRLKRSYCIDVEDNHNFMTESGIVHNCFDVIALYDIQEKLFKKFDAFVKNGWTQLPTLLAERHEVSEHYIKAKITGVKIDTEKMNELEVTFRNELLKYQFALENHEDIKKAEKLLIEMAIEKKKAKLKTPIKQIQIDKIINETKFNFNSSTQKRVLFYDILGIPKLYKTKTKNWATGKIIIEVFGEQYELLKYFKQYSIYSKGLTAFLGYNEEDYEEEEIDEEFDEYVEEEDEKEVTHTGIKACLDENNIVRANVNLTGTISSRTTTSNINLAQLPARGELYRLREMFIPFKGFRFMGFDFSNLELRLTGVYTNEPTIVDAFNNGYDLHSLTAYNVFKDKMDIDYSQPIEKVLKIIKEVYGDTYRYISKTLNFSLLYGISKIGLAKSLRTTEEKAQEMIDLYFKGNAKIAQWIKETRDLTCKIGYSENLHGLRLYCPDTLGYKQGKYFNWKAEKQLKKAVNFRVQSLNSTYMYRCMNSFFREIKERNWEDKVLLFCTIYDSMYVQVHESISNEEIEPLFIKHFVSKMGNVDIKIDISRGQTNKSWAEME